MQNRPMARIVPPAQRGPFTEMARHSLCKGVIADASHQSQSWSAAFPQKQTTERVKDESEG
jgi:hypothetical protein